MREKSFQRRIFDNLVALSTIDETLPHLNPNMLLDQNPVQSIHLRTFIRKWCEDLQKFVPGSPHLQRVAEASFQLAICFLLGIGTPKNESRGIIYLAQAASLCHWAAVSQFA